MREMAFSLSWRRTDQGLLVQPSGYMVVVNEGTNPFEINNIIQAAVAQARNEHPNDTDAAIRAIRKSLEGKAVVELLTNLTFDL